MTEKDFNNLFNTWFDPVRRYLFFRCGNQEVATDIAQEAFIRLWERNRSITAEVKAGLLYKIANDLLISYFRRQKVQLNYQGQLKIEDTQASPEDLLLHQEMLDRYTELLARMPETQRTVFLMSRMDELKYAEIAERMQISVKAVEKRMTLALKFIRKELQAYGTH